MPTAHASIKYTSGTEKGLVGWWKFDEGSKTLAADASGNHNTGTLSGTTKPTWVPGKRGGALSFDGSSGYVKLTKSVIPSGDWTVSAWINSNKIGSLNTIFSNDYQILRLETTGTIGVFDNGSNGTLGNLQIKNNTWYHVVWTYVGSTKLNGIYINGVLDKSGGNTVATYTANVPNIGAYYSPSIYFSGKIDDVRIYSRALSAAEILTLYKSGSEVVDKIQPVRLNKGLVGYWPFDGNTIVNNVADLSGNGNNGLLQPTNATSSMKVAGKIGQGLKFDGTTQYVSNTLSLPAANASGCAWFKSNNVATDQSIFSQGTNNNFRMRISGSFLYAYVGQDGGGTKSTDGTRAGLSSNVWTHSCMVFDGSTLKLYINGVFKQSVSAVTTLGTSALGFGIGAYQLSSSKFNGLIDDVRIYSRALNPAEVKALYNMGQVVVNKTPVNRINSGLVGYWSFDGSTISKGHVNDLSGNNNTAYPINIATSTFYTSGRIGQGGNFDGVNDNVTTTLTSNTAFDNTTFSASFWFKPVTNGVIVSKGGFVDGWYIDFNYNSPNKLSFFSKTSGATTALNRSSGTALTDKKWHHAVVVATTDTTTTANNTVSIYIDGVLSQGALTQTGAYGSSATAVKIGTRTTQPWNGLIDDVRIYNRALSPGEVKQLYNMGK